MQSFLLLACALLTSGVSAMMEQAGNPLGKVLELVDQLMARIDTDMDEEGKVYHEYSQWCEDTVKNAAFSAKNAGKQKATLEAKIIEFASDIKNADSKVEHLVAKISNAEKELKEATSIREKEQADFTASETELVDAVDALGRAIKTMEKQMAEGAAFAQVTTTDIAGLLTGLGAVLDAAALPSNDHQKLMSYIQAQQSAEADDEEVDEALGAPSAAAYKNKGGNILEVLQDMKDKADKQLADLRSTEVEAKHNYEMLEGALAQKRDADTKEMEEEKSEKSAAAETKASAEGDLEVTTKELKSSSDTYETTQASCLKVAADRETTVASQKEELQVLAGAKKMLVESTSGGAPSLLQVSTAAGTKRGAKIVSAVRRLARQYHSAALTQLASRLTVVLRHSHKGDPFAKIKGLVKDMIMKLEKQAGEDAREKAYCDEQMEKTEAKKGDLEDDIEKMTSRFDQAASKSAKLKQQVQELESELAAMAKEQAEIDKARQDGNAEFLIVKADDEKALNGIRKALGSLQDYYGSGKASMLQDKIDDTQFSALMQQPSKPETFSKSSGAGSGIIGILEVCESDIATSLAKATAEEDGAQAEYEKFSQENAVNKAASEQALKYKSQEIKSLQKALAEISADRDTANTELAAVDQYYGNIKARCIAKPEKYEEKTARRAAEIQGLKEALGILEDEAASLVQRKKRSSFRGTMAAE